MAVQGKVQGRRLRKDSWVTSAMTSVGTSYATGKAGTLAIKLASDKLRIEPQYVVITLSSISSTTAVTVLISTDTGGDVIIAPQTTATITTGVTTASVGTVALDWKVPYVDNSGTAQTWYIMCKGDAGTFTVDSVDMYSYEDL